MFRFQQLDDKKYVIQYKMPGRLGLISADSADFIIVLNEMHFFFKEKKSLYTLHFYSATYFNEAFVLVETNRDLNQSVKNNPNVNSIFRAKYFANTLTYQFSYSNGVANIKF